MYIVKPTCCHISCQNAIQFDYRAVSSLTNEIRIAMATIHAHDDLIVIPFVGIY